MLNKNLLWLAAAVAIAAAIAFGAIALGLAPRGMPELTPTIY